MKHATNHKWYSANVAARKAFGLGFPRPRGARKGPFWPSELPELHLPECESAELGFYLQ